MVMCKCKIKKTSKNAVFSGVSKERAFSITKITEIFQVDPELAGSKQ
jgi:hypothetical protein